MRFEAWFAIAAASSSVPPFYTKMSFGAAVLRQHIKCIAKRHDPAAGPGGRTGARPSEELTMRQFEIPALRRRIGTGFARLMALLRSVALGAAVALAGPAYAGDFHGGDHGRGGSHDRDFHGRDFHSNFDRFHAERFHHGFRRFVFPGFGVGLAFGAGYPWGGYYGYTEPIAPQYLYYCYNPPGYYPWVSQCWSSWVVVPAS